MRIVLTGGGTAGHVMPFESIIEGLRTKFLEEKASLPKQLEPNELYITFVGVADAKTREFFASYDVPAIHVPSGKMRRYASAHNIVDTLFRLPIGLVKALVHIWRIMPDVVISKGGYGSIPVVLAAAFYRIPILLHESDVIPGLTNAKLLRFASAITVGFPSAKEFLKQWEYKVFVTGTPVRPNLGQVPAAEAKKAFGIPANERVLLVMGGSQGAKQLNEILLKILPEIIPDMAVLHLTGTDHYQAVSTVAKELIDHSPRRDMYKAHAYLTDKMPLALAAADGVVTRAGASSLAEITALRKPVLIIPLDGAANDHQRKNAQAFETKGAALILDPINLGQNIFKQNVLRLMTNDEARAALTKNIAQLDYPQAGNTIAALAFKLATGFAPQRKKKQ